MQINWFAIFKVKVTAKAHILRFDCFYYVFWASDPLATKLDLMVHHHKLEYLVKKKMDCFVQDPPVNVCPNDIF